MNKAAKKALNEFLLKAKITGMCIMNDEDREKFLSYMPEPPNNIQWEGYLNGHFLRTDRIGETIYFARYGNPPQNGLSRFMKTLGRGLKSYPELKGVSVFEIVEGKEIYPIDYHYLPISVLFDRPRFTGIGEIVGWGPDGEPLVNILEII